MVLEPICREFTIILCFSLVLVFPSKNLKQELCIPAQKLWSKHKFTKYNTLGIWKTNYSVDLNREHLNNKLLLVRYWDVQYLNGSSVTTTLINTNFFFSWMLRQRPTEASPSQQKQMELFSWLPLRRTNHLCPNQPIVRLVC